MAAQDIPDEKKPLLKSRGFWLAIIGAATGVLLTAIFGGGGGSSDNASVKVIQIPNQYNDWSLQVDGTGWNGDNEVEVYTPSGSENELVHQGAFSHTAGPLDCGGGSREVVVVGKTSRHEVSGEFKYLRVC